MKTLSYDDLMIALDNLSKEEDRVAKAVEGLVNNPEDKEVRDSWLNVIHWHLCLVMLLL